MGRADKIVFTNGIFDILHPGHISTIEFASLFKRQNLPECFVDGPFNDRLIVGINSDESASRLKGSKRPIMDAKARKKVLLALSDVDDVVIFEDDTPELLIEIIRPDVIVKGGDYQTEHIVGSDKYQVEIAPYNNEYSTTKIIERILERYR